MGTANPGDRMELHLPVPARSSTKLAVQSYDLGGVTAWGIKTTTIKGALLELSKLKDRAKDWVGLLAPHRVEGKSKHVCDWMAPLSSFPTSQEQSGRRLGDGACCDPDPRLLMWSRCYGFRWRA